MKKTLRFLVRSLAALSAVLLLALLTVLLRPRLVFNTGSLAWGLRTFAGAYQPRWSSLALEARAASLLDKELLLQAADFCFADRRGSVEGCFKEVDIHVALRLGSPLRLTRVERFTVLGDHLALDPSNRPASSRKSSVSRARPPALPQLLPESLRALRVEALRVELPRSELRTASGTIKGDISLRLRPQAARPLLFTAAGRRGGRRLSARAELDSDLFRVGELTYLDVQGTLDDGEKRARLSARAEQSGADETQFRLSLRAQASGRRLETLWRGVQAADHYEARGSAEFSSSKGPLRSARVRDCAVRVPLKAGSTRPAAADVTCLFRAAPRLAGLGGAKLKAFEGKVVSRTLFGALDRFTSHLEVDLVPVKDWYELSAGLKGDFSGRMSRLLETLKVEQTLDATLSVARFERLVELLKGSDYEVPAPFHVLNGPLTASVRGRGDPRGQVQALDYAFSSDLASGKQRLKVSGKGRLTARRALLAKGGLSAKAEVALAEVALELPRLEVTSMPKVMVDKRILLADAGPVRDAVARPLPKAPVLPLEAALHVATSKPALLYSNLAKQPVPVALDLDVLSPPVRLSGTITLLRFDVELFRRLAAVERAALRFTPGSRLVELDGLILYRTSDAVINIALLGSTEKPRVELTSQPPMDKNAIISLLLFGKSPSELDSDQQASVGNTQNALATQAFGLASLYLFASTPIEYVGYDPASQTYAVKFRLPGGASLEVGSNFEESRHVRLRKRLSSRWAIQTEMRSHTETGNAVETLLEWFQRY